MGAQVILAQGYIRVECTAMAVVADVNLETQETSDLELLEEESSERSQVPRTSAIRRKGVLTVFLAVGVLCCTFAITYTRSPEADVPSDGALDFTSFYSSLGIDSSHHNMVQSNYSTSGLPKELIRNLAVLGSKKKTTNPRVRELHGASCAIDVTHATLYLQRAGLAITAATKSCKGASAREKTACAADISTIFASVGFVAEYISEAVLMCEQTIDMKARCAGGISGIVANTARLATQASFMAANCKGGVTYDDTPMGDSVWQMDRRLQDDSSHPTYNEDTVGTYGCVLDATQSANYLANFGISIDGATKSCGEGKSNIPMGLLHPHNREAHQVYCAMNVLEILESIFEAGAFISSAVSHCSPQTNQQALCASGAVGVTGALTGLTKSILNVYGACEDDPLKKVVSPKYQAAEKVTAWNDYKGSKP